MSEPGTPSGGNAAAPSQEKPKPTPLNKKVMIVTGAAFLTESMCITMLLPFVGLYVAHLQGISVEAAGYSSGILVGLFMLGQVVSSKMWGWLSDLYGRRIPLIVGLFAAAWTMLFFGMAPNIYVCCVLRFTHGIFNGNTLVAKIVLADITDSTNAAKGFALGGIMWCVGCIVGPAVGGFLYDPLHNPSLQWMHVKEGSFLGENPAFLSSFVIFMYTIVTLGMCLAMLPETNKHRTGSLRTVPVVGWLLNHFHPKETTMVDLEATAEQAPQERFDEEDDNDALGNANTAGEGVAGKAGELTFMKALKDPYLSTISILYMCISASDMCFGEIMPLWAIAPKDVGGLAMFADAVGGLMLLFAVPTFLSTFFFSTVYNGLNNSALMWQGGMAICIVCCILFPYAALMSDRVAYWFLFVLGSIRDVVFAALYDVVGILTAKAAPPGSLGSAYGITQSLASMVRGAVPFVVAPVFAWSITGHHVFPFNHYFVFFLSVIPMAYSIYRTWAYKIEPTEEDRLAMEAGEQERVAAAAAVEDRQSVAEEYRSLANSFAGSYVDNVLPHLREVEHARHEVIADWLRYTAPRGRGQHLHSAAKTLQHEDWRLTDEKRHEEELESETLGQPVGEGGLWKGVP